MLILALLLPALVLVEKLVLHPGPGFIRFYYYFDMVMERAARRERPFDLQPAFESLTVFETHSSFLLSEALMASLLKLPAIRVISGCLDYTWDGMVGKREKFTELDNSSSPVTSLNLAACASNPKNLGHILRARKALKAFSYAVTEFALLDFTKIRRSLGPQEKCLERLGFDHDEDDGLKDYLFGYGVDETDRPFRAHDIICHSTSSRPRRSSFDRQLTGSKAKISSIIFRPALRRSI